MALSKIVENSLADEAVSSAKLKDFSAAVDLNGVELVLDADADTSITADTDDRIDFKIAGVEHFSFSNSSGDTIIKPMVDAKDIKFQQFDGRTLLDINDGGFVGIANGATSSGEIRFFEDTDNGSNYVGLNAGSISSSFTLTLPTADGSSGQFLKTDGSGALSFDTVSSAADDLTAGDAAVSLTTTAGNITIDAQGNDTDIIFKGTDGSSDTTFLTLDGSDAGTAIFNHDIKIADDGQIGSASAADAMIISSGGIVTFKDDIKIKDGGTIGSASDADSITIASGGAVTFSQNPVFPAGGVDIASLDIDGATDIGAAIVDADLFIIDDGAGGTNRKVAASRIKTYIGASTAADDLTIGDAAVTLSTSSGNITIDATANDSDIIFKGTDNTADITMLTLDGSEAGKATFNSGIVTGGASNLEGGVVINEDSASVDFRVESNGDANCLIVDGSGDKVGIGEDVPEGKLHIFTGDASVGPNADADELVVEGSGNSGISILSGNTSNGAILFGDSGDDNIGIIDYDHNTNGMTFFANAQHFFKIASNGEVSINDTEIATGAPVFKVKGATNNTVAIFDHRNTSGSETLFTFRDGEAQTCGSIGINPGSNTVAYNTSSDYRLKQSEEDITDGITKVKQLKPYRFNWKSNPSGDKVSGFFAHEVLGIIPESVQGTKDETETLKNVVLNADGTVKDSGILQPDWEKGKTEAGGEIFASNTTWVAEKTGQPKYQVIDHSKLVPVLTAALKESITKIEALEARVTTLEG